MKREGREIGKGKIIYKRRERERSEFREDVGEK